MRKIFQKPLSGLTKLEIITGLYIFCLFASETMGFKLIHLFDIGGVPINVSVAIFVLPFIFSINDMVVETHGIKKAKALSQLGFMIIAGIAILSLLFTFLPPAPRFAAMNDAYNAVFSFSLRASIASLTAFLIAQFTDIVVYYRIRKKMGEKALWFRNNVSNAVGLFIDTVVFMTIARYDLSANLGENILFLIGLILPYWVLKCCMSLVITPVTYAGVRWLKSKGHASVKPQKKMKAL